MVVVRRDLFGSETGQMNRAPEPVTSACEVAVASLGFGETPRSPQPWKGDRPAQLQLEPVARTERRRYAELTLDPILTPGEVADLLRMRKSWVYNAARTGELPHLRLGRAVRFRRSAIDAYLVGIESGGELPVARAAARVRLG